MNWRTFGMATCFGPSLLPWCAAFSSFHPLVWLSERQLKMAQEMAADELAIAHQDHDPIRYGRLLVSVLSKLGSTRVIPTTSMGTAGPMHSLKRRLSAMSLYGQVSRRVVATSAVLLGATVLLGLAPWKVVAADAANGEKPLAQRTATIKISEGEAGNTPDGGFRSYGRLHSW
jgi:beta-lactamase regulating signal transducer with metallopeptidase domain